MPPTAYSLNGILLDANRECETRQRLAQHTRHHRNPDYGGDLIMNFNMGPLGTPTAQQSYPKTWHRQILQLIAYQNLTSNYPADPETGSPGQVPFSFGSKRSSRNFARQATLHMALAKEATRLLIIQTSSALKRAIWSSTTLINSSRTSGIN